MHSWFIFTSTGGFFTSQADTITKAVAEFKRSNHPRAGEVVGVIRGAAAMEYSGSPLPTPVFGVVCCVAERPLSQGKPNGR